MQCQNQDQDPRTATTPLLAFCSSLSLRFSVIDASAIPPYDRRSGPVPEDIRNFANTHTSVYRSPLNTSTTPAPSSCRFKREISAASSTVRSRIHLKLVPEAHQQVPSLSRDDHRPNMNQYRSNHNPLDYFFGTRPKTVSRSPIQVVLTGPDVR